MATQADVRRIALALPGTDEVKGRFAFAVLNKGKLKGFVRAWNERVHPKKPKVRKDFLLQSDKVKFFTEPHYDGYAAVLVRLPAVTARQLKPIITEAWRCMAPRPK